MTTREIIKELNRRIQVTNELNKEAKDNKIIYFNSGAISALELMIEFIERNENGR